MLFLIGRGQGYDVIGCPMPQLGGPGQDIYINCKMISCPTKLLSAEVDWYLRFRSHNVVTYPVEQINVDL